MRLYKILNYVILFCEIIKTLMIIYLICNKDDRSVPICSSTFRKIYGAFAQISLALADMSNRQTNTMVVIAGERAKNIKTGGLKKC